MDKKFAKTWLEKLKTFWFNKDIENAVSLFSNTNFIKKHLLWHHIQHLMK